MIRALPLILLLSLALGCAGMKNMSDAGKVLVCKSVIASFSGECGRLEKQGKHAVLGCREAIQDLSQGCEAAINDDPAALCARVAAKAVHCDAFHKSRDVASCETGVGLLTVACVIGMPSKSASSETRDGDGTTCYEVKQGRAEFWAGFAADGGESV